ncbi:response regulator [Planctomycetes bacterium K23_9]|uniref:C4-dicarboxylate transport transcriptional regulatory protein DctD n=1 Tax=Stieleria marina TaxID=1930275 RepID=A0A517NYH3_9BACT|nr:C4-dicarboxylate transport transcriptional regulatory protein DctD [Planctomycetes bacterium K23_9]
MNSIPNIGIVEDNDSVRESLQALVKVWGYHAFAFSSAEELLACKDLDRLDCLILDFNLPGINAQELISELDQLDQSVPTIVVSGTIDAAKSTQLHQSGVIAVLGKPIPGTELMELVKTTVS